MVRVVEEVLLRGTEDMLLVERASKIHRSLPYFSNPISRTSSSDDGLIIWLILVSISGVIIAIICYRRKKSREQPVFVQAVQPQQILQIMPQPVEININNSVVDDNGQLVAVQQPPTIERFVQSNNSYNQTIRAIEQFVQSNENS